jgi:hypothetical protein
LCLRVGSDYYVRKGGTPMIGGSVSNEDVPIVQLAVAGQTWKAVIDTGFNGDLELPAALQPLLNARYLFRTRSLLGAGQIIDEDT